MSSIYGLLFDGKSVNKKSTALKVGSLGECSIADYPRAKFHFSYIKLSPRNGDTTRFLTLPNGMLLESEDNDLIDQLANTFGHDKKPKSFNRGILYVTALLVLLFIVWSSVRFGIPALTYKAAMMVPNETLVEFGQEGLDQLGDVFTESQMSEVRQQEIVTAFDAIIPTGEDALPYKLHFRQAVDIGANAFALPSGDIIITDRLLELAGSDDEVIAVLLHEIAHVERRHGIQSIIQSSFLLLSVVVLSGDVTSLATLVLAVPALLLNSNYSRHMEWDADSYALVEMQKKGMNPAIFLTIFEKIVEDHQKLERELANLENGDDGSFDNEGSYLASHPASSERVARFQKASEEWLENQ